MIRQVARCLLGLVADVLFGRDSGDVVRVPHQRAGDRMSIERTCPGCRGEGKLTGDGGGMDGGGNYHHPPCETCDDDTHVVPAHAYRGAFDLLRQARGYVADHAAAHPCDELAARLWSEIDDAITAGGQ